jgi:hypothetical protein
MFPPVRIGEWGDHDNVAAAHQCSPGGVNGVLCDGAVRFFTDNINTGNLGLPQNRDAPSVYGVCCRSTPAATASAD